MFEGQLQQIAFIWCFALYFSSCAQNVTLVSLLESEDFVIMKKIDFLGKFTRKQPDIFLIDFYLFTVCNVQMLIIGYKSSADQLPVF